MKAHKQTHQCWRDMLQRCNNPNNRRYYTHGARGIKVCTSWENSYQQFINDMGEKPEGYTIERVDNNKGYSKDNCKWATPKEQAQNRRTNINITHKNETKNIQQWAKVIGISFPAMKQRLSRHPLERALSLERYDYLTTSPIIKETILKEYLSGEYTQKQLADLYQISQAVISKWAVKRRKELCS